MVVDLNVWVGVGTMYPDDGTVLCPGNYYPEVLLVGVRCGAVVLAVLVLLVVGRCVGRRGFFGGVPSSVVLWSSGPFASSCRVGEYPLGESVVVCSFIVLPLGAVIDVALSSGEVSGVGLGSAVSDLYEYRRGW